MKIIILSHKGERCVYKHAPERYKPPPLVKQSLVPHPGYMFKKFLFEFVEFLSSFYHSKFLAKKTISISDL